MLGKTDRILKHWKREKHSNTIREVAAEIQKSR